MSRGYLRTIGIAALIGVPAAFAAALLLALVHEIEHRLWPSRPAWWLVLLLPLAGAVVVLAARRLLPGDGGHSPLVGLAGGPTPPSHVPGVVLAALGTLCFGAVLGPEAPVVALGSAIGLLAASAGRLRTKDDTAMVATAGQFSAISALFGGPVIAGMLLVEGGVGLGAALLPALLPGLVAAAVGYVIFIGLGRWGGLNTSGLSVGDLPEYRGTHVYDLLLAIAVGAVAALVLAAVRRAAVRVDALPGRFGAAATLLAGGLAVGALALLARGLGDNSQDVLFSGQASITAAVSTAPTRLLVVLLGTKAVAYAISLGCGFRGGPIFPAIFTGVALASFPVVWFHTSPTVAVAVGAAAGMAAQTNLLFSPLILSTLLVGSAGKDAIAAAVLATASAWLTARALAAKTAPAPAG